MTKIEIFSDVVCPWCYVGKRNLEKALQLLNDKEEKFESIQNWRSFQLNPQLKPEGILRQDYITSKFGETANSEIIYNNVSYSNALTCVSSRNLIVSLTASSH